MRFCGCAAVFFSYVVYAHLPIYTYTRNIKLVYVVGHFANGERRKNDYIIIIIVVNVITTDDDETFRERLVRFSTTSIPRDDDQ